MRLTKLWWICVPLLTACNNGTETMVQNSPPPTAIEQLLNDYCARAEATRSVDYAVGKVTIEATETKTYYFDGKNAHPVSEKTRADENDNLYEVTRADFTSSAGADGYAYLSTTPGREGVYFFTPKGEISDTTYNVGLKMVLGNIPDAVGSLGMEQDKPQFPDSVSGIGTGILLKTTWNQGDPYNKKMPECTCSQCTVDPQRSLVGCTNVAVGQVIAYWGRFDATIDDNKTINFKRLTLYPVPQTEDDEKQIASFLYEVAMRNHTNLSHSLSTASFMAALYLLRECGYDCSFEYTEIDQSKLNEYLFLKRSPCIYMGFISETLGHAWVIDGYKVDTEVQYHCNWGWGGSSDGWAVFDAIMKPTSTTSYDLYNGTIFINN